MKGPWFFLRIGTLLLCICTGIPGAWAETSSCEECHIQITPKQVEDFNRGRMSRIMPCTSCHGEAHTTNDDAEKAEHPTIETCRHCHEARVDQYLSGKHARKLTPLTAMPYTHNQPLAIVEGQKDCLYCHTAGLEDEKAQQRTYYRYGMDCQNCHTRHAFSREEAAEPEACMPCHRGFDHAQWEMWSVSKHGVSYTANRAVNKPHQARAPTCQTCHMPIGNHRVFSAWGFLAVRLPEEDREWRGYRTSILKALGLLDSEGNPTVRMDVVKKADMARLSAEEFQAERKRYSDICITCHAPSFVSENMKKADHMIKEADKLCAEAIEIVAGLYRDGIMVKKTGGGTYPDLLTFYETRTEIEGILYDMFMDHRMKTIQGAFHVNCHYSRWYGYTKMKQDLREIRDLEKTMRSELLPPYFYR